MEMINIPKEEYEKMKRQITKLKELEEKNKGIMLKKSIPETALWSEKSLAKTWLSEEEDEAWKDL